jgi:hypothetical protein
MSTVIEQIEQQISKLSNKAVRKNTGIIRTVADGVAKIDGLSDVAYNEMVQFPGGVIGIALNLGADEVGAVVLGDVSQLKEGDEVSTTGKLLSVPVGKALLGRVVDALGNPVDGKGPLGATETYPVERIAPGVMSRKSVNQPLFTGIQAIDSMIPIGRGQRELIIGDRGTGKTTIATRPRSTRSASLPATPSSAPFIPSTSPSDKRTPTSSAPSTPLRRPARLSSPASSAPPPPTTPPTNTSPPSPAPPSANGSWKTAWMP